MSSPGGNYGTESSRPCQTDHNDHHMNEQHDEVAHPGSGNNTSQPAVFRPICQFATDRVEHKYFREGGAWTYLAAWDAHRAKGFGRCEVKEWDGSSRASRQ